MGAVQLKHDKYEAGKLDAIYQNLVSAHEAGKIQSYEIKVDDFPVVGKNTDPSRFMSYADFISSDTKCVSVFLYRPNGQSDKFFFHLTASIPLANEQVGGLHTSGEKKESPDNGELARKDMRIFELIHENTELKKVKAEDDLVIEGLIKEVEDVKAGRDRNVFEWLGVLGTGLMGVNTVKTGAQAFSGTETTQEKGENFFKSKPVQDVKEEEHETIELTDKERGYLLLLDDIRVRIGEVELANVMHLLDLVSKNPQAIHYAIRHVTNFLKQQTKPNDNEKF